MHAATVAWPHKRDSPGPSCSLCSLKPYHAGRAWEGLTVTSRGVLLRRHVLAASLSLCATLSALMTLTTPARAAVTHEFFPALSAKISEGVPAGCADG
jgi:hypothetical protein